MATNGEVVGGGGSNGLCRGPAIALLLAPASIGMLPHRSGGLRVPLLPTRSEEAGPTIECPAWRSNTCCRSTPNMSWLALL